MYMRLPFLCRSCKLRHAMPRRWSYRLEQLYEDQDPDFVLDAIPHLICWIDPGDIVRSHRFELREHTRNGDVDHELTLSWDVRRLSERDPRLTVDLVRFRDGKTLTIEDRAKYAAYGLAMVAISCLLRRRVVNVSYYRPPDLLLDTVSGALRGVEVAGRGSKGYAAFAQAADGTPGKLGKRAQLMAREDVVEAYLSLWCREPMVSIWEKVKP
ncbi:hypothetical protein [Sorangium sp. So ce131]|uniref:hypothetical protein n=1 Tax=Sorangium sp. So ce131 TaxID=3133282 RepID=UPI003F616176